MSELKAAAVEAEHKYATLSRLNDANANFASAPVATAEETKSLVAQIDAEWRSQIEDERRLSADAQRQSVEAQCQSI